MNVYSAINNVRNHILAILGRSDLLERAYEQGDITTGIKAAQHMVMLIEELDTLLGDIYHAIFAERYARTADVQEDARLIKEALAYIVCTLRNAMTKIDEVGVDVEQFNKYGNNIMKVLGTIKNT